MSLFTMPSLGADMEAAILMEWKVKEGDRVAKGDIVAEIEASKGVIEIEVFEDGTVEKLLVEEETECAVGTPMAIIRRDDETLAELEAQLAGSGAATSQTLPADTAAPVTEAETVPPQPETAAAEERIRVSPAARRRAEELGVDIASLATSSAGIIQIADVEAAANTPRPEVTKPESAATPIKATAPRKAPTPSHGMRQAIAAAMSRSNTEIPHYYLAAAVNMSPALQWLEQRNAQKSIQERVLPAALILHAVVQTLKEVPELNGFWRDDRHEISEAIHPGFAIALRKGGLITPALLDAQTKDLDQTMQAMGDLITRTRSSKLRGAELSNQTITVTNLGDLGVESVFGVIYPPQVALVGLGKIEDRPWVDADGGVGIRKVMQATLAGDHRATDGRTGARFLDRLKKLLEHPERLNGS
jgi:pyruvate dehydrogenase E2 component (dihydrolipoamide acetyltransferase)